MPYTVQELANIANSTLDFYMDKGTVFAQNIQDKPLLAAFEEAAGEFPGGKGDVSIGVKQGHGGGALTGYSHDDQVGYYNPASNKRVAYPWREHHIGIGVTHTELKTDGITVVENAGAQTTTQKNDREEFALANLLEEKQNELAEDYQFSKNRLLHGDGTSDAKAIAGFRSFILDNPAVGTTGGLSRVSNTWWRNRARTTAASSVITSSTANGGALLQVLQTEYRQLRRYAKGGVKHRCIAGSDFMGALEVELRANGRYSDTGYRQRGQVNGGMATVDSIPFLDWTIQYDPTMDDLGRSKFMNVIDMRRIRLLHMQGEKMKKVAPVRPYDRYVMYSGFTMTGVLVAQQLNTSGVYEIS
jgi:hypothetical protein